MSRSLPLSTVLIEEFAAGGPAEKAAAEAFGVERRRAAWKEKLAEEKVDREGTGRKKLEERVEEAVLADLFDFLHRNKKRAALCLSGGGIRSATFGLGVLQGLARQGLLRQFDFLSTVSGGGYVGSWLSAWIHRLHDPSQADPAAAVARLEHELLARPRFVSTAASRSTSISRRTRIRFFRTSRPPTSSIRKRSSRAIGRSASIWSAGSSAAVRSPAGPSFSRRKARGSGGRPENLPRRRPFARRGEGGRKA